MLFPYATMFLISILLQHVLRQIMYHFSFLHSFPLLRLNVMTAKALFIIIHV